MYSEPGIATDNQWIDPINVTKQTLRIFIQYGLITKTLMAFY